MLLGLLQVLEHVLLLLETLHLLADPLMALSLSRLELLVSPLGVELRPQGALSTCVVGDG